MKHQQNKKSIMIVQDDQITHAYFQTNAHVATLQSYKTIPLQHSTTINGLIFDPVAMSSMIQTTPATPLSLCLFSSEIQEYISDKKDPATYFTAEKKEKYNPLKMYAEPLFKSSSKKPLWYHASIPYHIIMYYVLCASKAQRTIHAITFPLQALLSLFYFYQHQHTNSPFVTENTTHQELLTLFTNQRPEQKVPLFYAQGIAHMRSIVS